MTKYPPFPFEYSRYNKDIYELDINRKYSIRNYFASVSVSGYISRFGIFNDDSTFSPGTVEQFEARIEEFKKLHDFNNSFEDHLNG